MTKPHRTSDLCKVSRDCAWIALKDNFVRTRPQRFVSGVAITSRAPNANGSAFVAGGAQFTLPIPLLWDHEWTRPIGKVTEVSVRGDQLWFRAELANSGHLSAAEDVWRGLLDRADHGVSVQGANLKGNMYAPFEYWALEEISISEAGADPGARVTAVSEKAHVLYCDNRPKEKVFWREVA